MHSWSSLDCLRITGPSLCAYLPAPWQLGCTTQCSPAGTALEVMHTGLALWWLTPLMHWGFTLDWTRLCTRLLAGQYCLLPLLGCRSVLVQVHLLKARDFGAEASLLRP